MNRRGFLKLFAGAAAAAQVVPKSYFFAPIGGWTSDLILNPASLPIEVGLNFYQGSPHKPAYLYPLKWEGIHGPSPQGPSLRTFNYPFGPKDFPYRSRT